MTMERQTIRKMILFLSFLTFPITLYYLSPYLMIAAAYERTINTGMIFWALLLATSLIIGRLACAYICPLGAAQMMLDSVLDKRLKEFRGLRAVKYALGATWLGAFLVVLISAGGYTKIDLFYGAPNIISVSDVHSVTMYYVMVLLAIVPAALLGKRAFCHYLCPFSVLNIAGAKIKGLFKWPSLQLVSDATKCTACKKCDRGCPMSLGVSGMVKSGSMKNTECILCGSCIDGCPRKAILYGHGNLGKGHAIEVKAKGQIN